VQKLGYEHFIVFAGEVVHGCESHDPIHRSRFNEPDEYAANAFEHAVESLDGDSGVKCFIEQR
jgi:hypothetical protein